MAPAACLLKERGLQVEGFDLHFYPPLGPALQGMDIKCHGQGEVTKELLQSFDLIVVGNVVPRDGEEAKMIEQLGVPFCSFPAALGSLILRDRNVLGICGTHGKTTTTYFAVQLFEFFGGRPWPSYRGSSGGSPLVSIGDGGAFFLSRAMSTIVPIFTRYPNSVSYHLNSMILTSLEFDHADIFF